MQVKLKEQTNKANWRGPDGVNRGRLSKQIEIRLFGTRRFGKPMNYENRTNENDALRQAEERHFQEISKDFPDLSDLENLQLPDH